MTYAERLGWPRGARVVVFHVDDAGMSYDSNMGTIRAIEQGIATSTSIMMPCPWVPQFAEWLKGHPQADAGLHLTLTPSGKTIAGARSRAGPRCPAWSMSRVVSGTASPTWSSMPRPMSSKPRSGPSSTRPWPWGSKPTHLDSHMGTCFQMPFIERYVKVGIEKQIPILMFGGHLQHVGEEAGVPPLHQRPGREGLERGPARDRRPRDQADERDDFEGRKAS